MQTKGKRIIHIPVHLLEKVRKQLLKYGKRRKCNLMCCMTQCLHKVAKLRREAERKKYKRFKSMKCYSRVKQQESAYTINIDLNGKTLIKDNLWL